MALRHGRSEGRRCRATWPRTVSPRATSCCTAWSAATPTARSPPGHELVYEVAVEGGRALIFNDLLGNGPKLTCFKGAIFNLLGSGGVLGVPRIVRMMFVSDAAKVRGFLERLAAEPWKAITLSHGDAITDDCAGHLRRAAERL